MCWQARVEIGAPIQGFCSKQRLWRAFLLKLRLKIQYAFGYTMSLWLYRGVSLYDLGDRSCNRMAGSDSKPVLSR
jgi:hypothetical protein